LQPIHLALRRQRDFVADAAHELRTPLAIQRTAMELGLAADTLGAQQGAIEQALSQNVHLARLVDSLSLLARADSGAVTLERGPVDLARLAVEAGNGVEILAEERAVRLRVEAPHDTWVSGDAGRLRQVLLILLDNALKFTPDHGAITVRVARQGGQARLEVRDSGPGIAAEDLPYLFDRFYRADKARSSGGTGLGLAIARWIVEAHGGRITAANAPGGGALFAVTLPLIQGS
jgi:signal transduction histidine kinase